MNTNFKKTFSAVVLGSFCFLAMSFSVNDGKPAGKPWNAPADAVKKTNPKANADGIKEGKELYSVHCKSCHGVKGKGDGPKAEKIDISCNDFTKPEFAKISDGELYWKTTEGRKPMPSFKEKLSDSERWAVVAYIKTMSK
ncbi:MAG: cytochrome c [Bacteroidia bacterium]|nr:cytochrome c [Bacteroidia bacterium]